MIDGIKAALSSKRVWVILALFVINGVAGVHDMLGPSVIAVVDPILTALGFIFGMKPSTK